MVKDRGCGVWVGGWWVVDGVRVCGCVDPLHPGSNPLPPPIFFLSIPAPFFVIFRVSPPKIHLVLGSQYISQRQLQAETRNISVWRFGAYYIKDFTVCVLCQRWQGKGAQSITSIVKCVNKCRCQASMVPLLKFRNEEVISSHTLPRIWLFIHARIEVKPC